MQSSKDLNQYLQLALESIAKVFVFDRSAFLMLVDDRTRVKSRLVVNQNATIEQRKVNLDISYDNNVIARVISSDTAALINDAKDLRWQRFLTEELREFIAKGVVAFVPVKISGKAIGVISMQLIESDQQIAKADFQQACALIEHLNMCLTMIRYN
jgi:hypothetical protein